jgi:hypothetical protein
VKVPSRDHVAFEVLRVGNEDERIIHRRVCLDLKYATAVRQSVAHRAMHLRNTAERIRVLHTSALAVRFANLATFEHPAQVRRGLGLAAVRTHFMNAFVEGRVRAF